MPNPSFKDVLLRDLKPKKFVDVSNMPDKGGLELSKSEHHSTSNSCTGLRRIWSSKPIIPIVNPGDKVIPEVILLEGKPNPRLKDVILRGLKQIKFVDVPNMPDTGWLELSKSEHHSTSSSYQGLRRTWSSKPIILNVNTGDKVIPEDILFDKGMPNPNFKDVLLRGSKQKRFVDVSNMPDKEGLELSKSVHHLTSNSYKGLDWKTLNSGIWSLKPITLNVNPGDKVILEDILLDKDGKVKHASFVKDLQEKYKDTYMCFFMLPVSYPHSRSTVLNILMLRDAQDEIKSSGGKLEVICVPTHVQDDERNNLEYIHIEVQSNTSFQLIYTNNDACLKQIESRIGFLKDPETAHVILGPLSGSCREVVSIFDLDFIKWYGAEAYPFTTEKIQQLAKEDEALWGCKHDLQTLLSIPGRDFVISNDRIKVPISDLQQKTVCLLFYEDDSECRMWTEKLKRLYVARKDFEVVVVFSATFGHDPKFSINSSKGRRELHFWKVFLDMPWLAIPFADPKCRQLWRIFNKMRNDCYAPKLIIYSEGNYFEENGFEVLQKTGFQNFPFMRTSRATISSRKNNLSSVLGRIELVRAEDLECGPWGRFTVSGLFGTRVVLLFLGVPGFTKLLADLEYVQIMTGCDINSFEIVYIPMMESPPDIVPDWMLVSPYSSKEHLSPLFWQFFKDEETQSSGKKFTLAVVSFEKFGHYFDRGIIYTNCSKEASKLFWETFPIKDNKVKKGIKDTVEKFTRGIVL